MTRVKWFYLSVELAKRLNQRTYLEKVIDWIWFYWYLKGNDENKSLNSSIKRRKARELKDFYSFKAKLKSNRKKRKKDTTKLKTAIWIIISAIVIMLCGVWIGYHLGYVKGYDGGFKWGEVRGYGKAKLKNYYEQHKKFQFRVVPKIEQEI